MPTPTAVLLPLTSLANLSTARDFIWWLKRHHYRGWQMLPINDPITTPYRNQGVGLSSYFYDDAVPEQFRRWVLTRDDFQTANKIWLADYALYRALTAQLGTSEWWQWPPELARREASALSQVRLRLASQINAYIDEQYFLYNSLIQLKRFASENEIVMMGDLPFYIAQNSSLVWAHQSLFMLTEDGQLKMQSGVPASPGEPFVEQFWGHPLYDWEGNSVRDIMNLFDIRLQFLSHFFDLIRIDHANGFFRYGIMSREHPAWCRKLTGPGREAVLALLERVQSLHLGIYFEDIASDKMRLEQFMKEYDIAGTSVLTLSYNPDQRPNSTVSTYQSEQLRLENLAGNKIVFSSSHDTAPLRTWWRGLPESVQQDFLLVNQLDPRLSVDQLAPQLLKRLVDLPARLVVVAWQDIVGDDFRFNVPGHEELTRWDYLVTSEQLAN